MVNTPPIPPRTSGVLHDSSLLPYVERYVTVLREQGYAANTIDQHIYSFRSFYRWFERRRGNLRELNERVVDGFLKSRKPDSHDGAPQAFRRLLGILRAAGVTPRAEATSRTPAQRIADEYRDHLRVGRSFAPKTVENYSRYVEGFLIDRFGASRADLRRLKLCEVICFVRRMGRERNAIFTKGLIIALRSFLRYLFQHEKIDADWAPSVPAIAHWHLTGLPKRLTSETVERILAACDQKTPVGRRDRAILLLLARLGLRGVEVVRLQLADIDWENAQLTVRSKKGDGWARLPLPSDVGRAIALYLRRDRPTCTCRNVFVRSVAPNAALNNSAVIGLRVRAAMKRAGVKSVRQGAHVFRHTLASEMLRHGASLDEIARLLRHKDHDSTAIYAKVDLGSLRRLVVALPGGAS
jgi:site-specific recombinase XerD